MNNKMDEIARKRARTTAFESSTSSTATEIINSTSVHNVSLDIINLNKASASTASSTKSTSDHMNQQLAIEIANLKAELTKVQSQRTIDKIKADNVEKRLKRHIISLEEDVEESTVLAEEIRLQSEKSLEEMNEARSIALKDARAWEQKYLELRHSNHGNNDGGGGDDDSNGDMELWKQQVKLANTKNENLQNKIQSMDVQMDTLRSQLKEFTTTNTTNNNEHTNTSNTSFPKSPLSHAPPPVLSELNRTRIELSESQRLNRQHNRKINDLQTKAELYIQYREQNTMMSTNIDKLNRELKVVRREREALRIVEARWCEFRKELVKHKLCTASASTNNVTELNDLTTKEESSTATSTSTSVHKKVKLDDENAPPEIASIIRQFHHQNEIIQTLTQTKHKTTTQLQTNQRQIQSLQSQIAEHTNQNNAHQKEHQKLISQLQKTNQELKIMHSLEKVWKREVEGLKSLLDTYNQTELNSSTRTNKSNSSTSINTSSSTKSTIIGGDQDNIVKDSDSDMMNQDENQNQTSTATATATISGLNLSLSSAKDKIQILTSQYESIQNEKEAIYKSNETLKEEHEHVRTKFELLKKALYQEREKAELAVERAFAAEALAGKGSFNGDTTKVLHLQCNPLSIALREKYQKEIDELKEVLKCSELEIEELKMAVGDTPSSTPNVTNTTMASDSKASSASKSKQDLSVLDAQKVTKRLKESFRHQIGTFREGVYLLTGYKVDMITDTDRPRFIVRSMYAENETDVLEFIWPELEEGKSPLSLDILNTDMAQVLSQEPSFDYMKKYNSLPAFMASVCLSLFEKQTLA